MSSALHPVAALSLRSVTYPAKFQPVEQTAAVELARFAGLTAAAAARPGPGVNVALAGRKWTKVPGAPRHRRLDVAAPHRGRHRRDHRQ